MKRFMQISIATGAFFTLIILASQRPLEGGEKTDPAQLFETADRCQACHNRMVSETGEDISIGVSWRSSMMAHAAKDPYWQASVRRETMEHPAAASAIEDKCATCHMPMARFVEQQSGETGKVLDRLPLGSSSGDAVSNQHLAKDGVSCSVCHQISSSKFGQKESFTGGFQIDTQVPPGKRTIFGPFDIASGTARIMRSSSGFNPKKSEHIRRSELCATCHTLYTHALDKNGKEVAELAEQVPFLEWLHSDYTESESCQDCHMETVKGKAPISSVLGKPREPFVRHSFRGGNFFMMRLMNQNAEELGVTTQPGELSQAAQETSQHLQNRSAGISIDIPNTKFEEGHLILPIAVENLTGHKLPTAYPSRRVWIDVSIYDSSGNHIFESGKLKPDGSIAGNDNDEDGERYEPHYTEISRPDQVQIYESIMGTPKGEVTTGLLKGAKYLKDNRVIPFGFDKKTAPKDVAVFGGANADANFVSGRDTVQYRIPIGDAKGPYKVEATLWYQSLGYRWAMNLDGLNAEEPKRFIKMYRASKRNTSAIQLAQTSVSIAPSVETAAHDDK